MSGADRSARSGTGPWLATFGLLACLASAGCERAMHDMYQQPKYKPGMPSKLFADDSSRRTPPPGTVPINARPADQQDFPEPVTAALLQRGRERFDIYCAPCHGRSGDGQGMVVQRGFPAPPSYHIERLRKAADSHLFDVITNGYGVMYPYADRIDTADRWAIIAYVRALQLSQNAPRDRLTQQDLQQLDSTQARR